MNKTVELEFSKNLYEASLVLKHIANTASTVRNNYVDQIHTEEVAAEIRTLVGDNLF